MEGSRKGTKGIRPVEIMDVSSMLFYCALAKRFITEVNIVGYR
jgi:hypothetical protein